MSSQSERPAATPLNETTVRSLDPAITVPTYERNRLRRSIVHLGVGGFHRAHQALYLDTLAQQGISYDWGLCGVGLLPPDKRMEQALLPQQCLYTLVERGAEAETAHVIGSITRYLFAPEQQQETLRTLADLETRIVSLTITEGGYGYNQVTGEFDPATPGVKDDLAHPTTPATVFGYICEALDQRRRSGIAPFSVLSCDNIQGNGALARKIFTSFARLRDDALANWIEANVTFPNCMVDRITPQTTDDDRAMVARVFGIADNWPVVAEPFLQWVVEDHFCNGRPPLEAVGVQFVPDVHPYESMKLRLLNAGHQAIAYLGYLCGYRLVHEVMADSRFPLFLARLLDEEVTDLLAPVPGVDLTEYKAKVIERFSNPKVRDQVLRLCQDASNRMPKFLLPSLHEALAAGRPHRLLVLALAGWFRFLSGTDEQGNPIPIDDMMAGELQPLAAQGRSDPRPLLGVHKLFGDLGEHPEVVQELQQALQSLYDEGAAATLDRYLRA